MAKTKTYYVIRSGWNAANQSSMGTVKNPKNKFESEPDRRGGEVVASIDEVPAAIQRVGDYLEFPQWLIDRCVQDMPAVEL